MDHLLRQYSRHFHRLFKDRAMRLAGFCHFCRNDPCRMQILQPHRFFQIIQIIIRQYIDRQFTFLKKRLYIFIQRRLDPDIPPYIQHISFITVQPMILTAICKDPFCPFVISDEGIPKTLRFDFFHLSPYNFQNLLRILQITVLHKITQQLPRVWFIFLYHGTGIIHKDCFDLIHLFSFPSSIIVSDIPKIPGS